MDKLSLPKLKLIWRLNCIESARWLRSGQEYEDWCTKRNLPILPQEDREAKAKEYEERANNYLNK